MRRLADLFASVLTLRQELPGSTEQPAAGLAALPPAELRFLEPMRAALVPTLAEEADKCTPCQSLILGKEGTNFRIAILA